MARSDDGNRKCYPERYSPDFLACSGRDLRFDAGLETGWTDLNEDSKVNDKDKSVELAISVNDEEYRFEMRWRTFLILLFMLVFSADLAAVAYFIQAIRWW
ncbi:hypothetical protein G9I05_004388 [Salmonella enterica]|nr:hypothetical protein [Salmonella enterica]EEN5590582.1 hypothetical protein [Salmonella enterica subsp. enterica serovar Mountpleasant]EIO8738848.1 hypothetical protein [Salmonella enterica]